MQKSLISNATKTYLKITVALVVVVKLILSAIIPLFDKTESRYAEIARLMAETNNWIVLHIDYQTPFWAKPPLSTWLSALSFSIFGVSELTARIPSIFISLLIIYGVYKILKFNIDTFIILAFLLLTTPEFLIHTGVVSTDTALNFCVVLIMLALYKAFENPNDKKWGFLVFIGIGLGLLTKGPLIIVLTAPPFFVWLLLHKFSIKQIWQNLPWLIGVIITVIMAVPWYYLADKMSPGFLDYFIVGEHFKRFLEPGWKGDLYGSGHAQPKGMIWVFLFIFTFPWFQLVLINLWKNRKSIFKDKWISFLVLWLIWTPLFFTMSRNILHTYILPVTVPIALLCLHYLKTINKKKVWIWLGSILPFLIIIASVVILLSGKAEFYSNTDKFLIKNNISKEKINQHEVFYWKEKSYSSQFYTKGKVNEIKNKESLQNKIAQKNNFYLLISNKKIKEIPSIIKNNFILIDNNYKNSLYRIKSYKLTKTH